MFFSWINFSPYTSAPHLHNSTECVSVSSPGAPSGMFAKADTLILGQPLFFEHLTNKPT